MSLLTKKPLSALITDSTPQQDGFYMPAEFAPLEKVWMIWPYRTDNWRDQAQPAKDAYKAVALAINRLRRHAKSLSPALNYD